MPEAASIINIKDAAAQVAVAAPELQRQPFRKKGEEPATEDLLANINRQLPFSDEAEKGVLSCLLQDPAERLAECRVTLPAAAFYHLPSRTVYETLLMCYDKNIPIDVVTLSSIMRDQGLLERVGGSSAISELYTFVPIAAHFSYYKKAILSKYMLRLLIHASSLNIHQAYEHGKESPDEDVTTLVDHAEQGA